MSSSKIISGTANITLGNATVRAVATLRTNLSVHHFLGAARFSREVGEIERTNKGKPFGGFFEEILWFSSACVLSCVAGLEAYANELFVDRATHFPDIPTELGDKLWELFEQKPVIEKFDMALLLKKKPSIDRGRRPAQDAAALIALRNALVHFKPEWDNQQRVHAQVSKALTTRFKPSPFLPGTEALFPRRWATVGCTRWAVKSAYSFVEQFETLAGVSPKIVALGERLRAERT